MHIKKVVIENIRIHRHVQLTFSKPAGFHVLIGDNGSGKSSLLRSIALALLGPDESRSLRQNWKDWLARNSDSGTIQLLLEYDKDYDKISSKGNTKKKSDLLNALLFSNDTGSVVLTSGDDSYAKRANWATENPEGWFSAGFGPFRRFSGGSSEWVKLFAIGSRSSSHLSVFDEDLALTEALDWLKELKYKALENHSGSERLLDAVKRLLNETSFLPHNSKFEHVDSTGVYLRDGNGTQVSATELSDGFRSVLSMTFELLRQISLRYDTVELLRSEGERLFVPFPGVVLIDEIDAHLHPTWQTRIGKWLTSVFPNIQFIVTTHSPLVCRAAAEGTIWRLPAPGSGTEAREIVGIDKDRLVFGDVLDAYGTTLFGKEVEQADEAKALMEEMIQLSRKQLNGHTTGSENKRLNHLRSTFSTVREHSYFTDEEVKF